MMRKPPTASPPWPKDWRKPGYRQLSDCGIAKTQWTSPGYCHRGCLSPAGLSQSGTNVSEAHPQQLCAAPIRPIRIYAGRIRPMPSRPQARPTPTNTVVSADGPFAETPCCAVSLPCPRPTIQPLHACPLFGCFTASPHSTFGVTTTDTTTSSAKPRGGEQGDPLMPALFSFGQNAAPQAIQRKLRPTELLLAYLDDIYARQSPPRV